MRVIGTPSIALALTTALTAARAEPPPPAPTDGAPTTDAPAVIATFTPSADAEAVDPDDWDARRLAALELFEAGRYAAAAVAFDTLADAARAPADRFWAGRLAETSRRRLAPPPGATTPSADGSEDAEAAVARDARRRTAGEMAVLYIDGVLYGLGTGAGLALVADADGLSPVVGSAFVMAGATAGGLALADARGAFGYGVPRSVSAGLRLGLLEGALWTGFAQSTVRADDELSVDALFWLNVGATTAGGVLGGVLGHTYGSTPGAAALVESVGLWSALTGALLGVGVLGDFDGESDDAVMLMGALALNLGAVGGVLMAADAAPSPSRVRYLDLGALTGLVGVGGLYLAALGDDVDGSTLALLGAFGVVGGAGTAWMLTRDMPRDAFAADGATLTLAPTPSGALVGLSGTWGG